MRRLGIVVAVAVLVAGCSSGSGSPAPPGDTAPYALRATTQQAIPPESQFTLLPYTLITTDGVVVTQGPVPAIFPGPLVPPLFGAPITETGFNQVVERARMLGLLEGDGNFRPPNPMPGGLTGVVELMVDGSGIALTGDPNANIECITTPCDAAPGSPEAFGTFWRELGELHLAIGDELGADTPYHPEGYALLIGVTPPDDSGLRRRRCRGRLKRHSPRPACRSAMQTCLAARPSKARTRRPWRRRLREPISSPCGRTRVSIPRMRCRSPSGRCCQGTTRATTCSGSTPEAPGPGIGVDGAPDAVDELGPCPLAAMRNERHGGDSRDGGTGRAEDQREG